jgi:hypothetical protein
VLVLFSPLIIHIDSSKASYFVQLTGILRIQLILSGGNYKIKIILFFVPITLDPGKWTGGISEVGKKVVKMGKDTDSFHYSLKKAKVYMKFFLELMGSFKLRKFRLDLDTDDFVLNAQLVPLVTCINDRYRHVLLTVNFSGENLIILTLQNRVFNLLVISFKYLILKMRRIRTN